MPSIIDSLFLELGIDTTKFSSDQTKALTKIAQFESQTKRASGKAASSVKTVGDAFRDLAKDSRVGASADRLDSLATKFKNLGVSMQASGGLGTPFGGMAKGLGMLLSPAALGAAAIGLVGAEVWDFNRKMTDSNATLARNAELSGMSTRNLWAMGEAAKTVGGNSEAIESSIANLQTTLAGASIGVGSATAQLVGMARLSPYGARFNRGGIGSGVDEESLFKAVHSMYQRQGRARTMALVTSYGLMNEDQANLAMSSGGWEEYQKALAKTKTITAPGGFEGVVRNSLKSQAGLGELDIEKAITAEQAYGGIQAPMQTLVGLVTNILAVLNAMLGLVSQIVNFVSGGKAVDAMQASQSWLSNLLPGVVAATSPDVIKQRQAMVRAKLMHGGESALNAAAITGNLTQESQLDPLATSDNGAHLGIAQWDKARQTAFAKQFGYQMGARSVSAAKQRFDQIQFLLTELKTTQRRAQSDLSAAPNLNLKTWSFQKDYERPGDTDHSFGKRFGFAQEVMNSLADMLSAASSAPAAVHHTVTSHTKIGDVHVHTPATDPKSHVEAVRKGISDQPLLNPIAQGVVSLATRGMVV